MNGLSQLLPGIMEDAGNDGEVAEPTALLEALNAIENPLAVLAGHDQANTLFGLLYQEYGFLAKLQQSTPFDPVYRSQWVALVRWLIRELRVWRAAADPGSHRLVAMFVVSQANDTANVFWEQMPENIGNNAELVERLSVLLRSFSTGMTTRGGMAPPISEKEAAEAFQAADRVGDWVGIGNQLRFFEHQLMPSTILMQPVRCLFRCGIPYLVMATAG